MLFRRAGGRHDNFSAKLPSSKLPTLLRRAELLTKNGTFFDCVRFLRGVDATDVQGSHSHDASSSSSSSSPLLPLFADFNNRLFDDRVVRGLNLPNALSTCDILDDTGLLTPAVLYGPFGKRLQAVVHGASPRDFARMSPWLVKYYDDNTLEELYRSFVRKAVTLLESPMGVEELVAIIRFLVRFPKWVDPEVVLDAVRGDLDRIARHHSYFPEVVAFMCIRDEIDKEIWSMCDNFFHSCFDTLFAHVVIAHYRLVSGTRRGKHESPRSYSTTKRPIGTADEAVYALEYAVEHLHESTHTTLLHHIADRLAGLNVERTIHTVPRLIRHLITHMPDVAEDILSNVCSRSGHIHVHYLAAVLKVTEGLEGEGDGFCPNLRAAITKSVLVRPVEELRRLHPALRLVVVRARHTLLDLKGGSAGGNNVVNMDM